MAASCQSALSCLGVLLVFVKALTLQMIFCKLQQSCLADLRLLTSWLSDIMAPLIEREMVGVAIKNMALPPEVQCGEVAVTYCSILGWKKAAWITRFGLGWG